MAVLVKPLMALFNSLLVLACRHCFLSLLKPADHLLKVLLSVQLHEPLCVVVFRVIQGSHTFRDVLWCKFKTARNSDTVMPLLVVLRDHWRVHESKSSCVIQFRSLVSDVRLSIIQLRYKFLCVSRRLQSRERIAKCLPVIQPFGGI